MYLFIHFFFFFILVLHVVQIVMETALILRQGSLTRLGIDRMASMLNTAVGGNSSKKTGNYASYHQYKVRFVWLAHHSGVLW